MNLRKYIYNMVKCQNCYKEFEDAIGDVEICTQGIDCASSIFIHEDQMYLLGHYGSSLCDGNLYKFVDSNSRDRDEFPPDYKLDPVCDVCIKGMMESGALEQVPGQYLFGYPPPEWAL